MSGWLKPRGRCECGQVGAITKQGVLYAHGYNPRRDGQSYCSGKIVERFGENGKPPTPELLSTNATMRDYFAASSGSAMIDELALLAGADVQPSEFEWVLPKEGDSRPTLRAWWASVPLADRMALIARWKYLMADAMLAARKVTP